MEQAQAMLGLLLIILVSLALVSAVAIILLIELGWIVRLTARLYWRWRSSVHSPQVGRDEPRLARRRLQHSSGQYPRWSRRATAGRRGRGDGGPHEHARRRLRHRSVGASRRTSSRRSA